MKLLFFLAMIGSVSCQELYRSYNTSSIELSGAGFCPSTEELREMIKRDVYMFLNSSVVPVFRGYGACG